MPPVAAARRREAWLRLTLRLVLALALIPDGLSRLIPVEAPPPLPSTLLLRLGELAPYRLLETFLGYSPGYQAFTGLPALLAGLLLLSARTALLGALLAAATLGMLALQQLLYAGPALVSSSLLLALSLLLLAPDLRRLADGLLFHRPVEPVPEASYFGEPERDRRLRAAVACLGLAAVGFGLARSALRFGETYPSRPPLYGAWAVERLSLDGVEVSPPSAPPGAWGWLAFDRPGEVVVERRIGSRQRRSLAVDEKGRTLRLAGAGGKVVTLAFIQPEPNRLFLDGRVEGRLFRAELRRMTLLSTPYHWPWGPEYEE